MIAFKRALFIAAILAIVLVTTYAFPSVHSGQADVSDGKSRPPTPPTGLGVANSRQEKRVARAAIDRELIKCYYNPNCKKNLAMRFKV